MVCYVRKLTSTHWAYGIGVVLLFAQCFDFPAGNAMN